jgi:methyl-accepting chemotaxis protein
MSDSRLAMSRLLNLSTRSKLFVGFAVMIVFVAVAVGLGVVGINALRARQGEVYRTDFLNAQDLQLLLANQNAIRAAQLQVMLLKDRAEQERLEQVVHDKAEANRQALLRLLERNRNQPERLALLQELDRVRAAFRQTRDHELIPLIFAGKIAEAQHLALGVQAQRFERMWALGQRAIQQAEAHARFSMQASEQQASITIWLFVLTGVVALLAAVQMARLLARWIAAPLSEISQVATRIAQGDLSFQLADGGRRDEIGKLQQQFRHMALSLQDKATLARRIAAGDLSVQVVPQGERDALGHAFAAMLGSLKAKAEEAQRIAKGDLTVTVVAQSEQDVLGQAFAAMVNNLRQMNREVQEGMNVLAASASEIRVGTIQIASGAEQTVVSVAETTTTLEEVKQTAQVSSQKAKTVSTAAQKAAQVSQSGKKAVEQAIDGMQRIHEQMEQIAERIVRLSEQTQAIGEIITTVNDLAEQSNLLAVNASIEAAKAGEQGKGFAVVAGEVKSLAEQSKQATVQVRAILGDIQKATSGAVLATEQGGKAVQDGVRQSHEAGEAIRQLAASITESAQSAAQIAVSAQQQLAGMDQLALAMDNIRVASSQNVTSSKQAERAAQNLHELGQKLKGMLARYHI